MYFNPRSPHGERQGFKFRGIDDVIFQPTLPARGATVRTFPSVLHPHNFNPRSPHGERPGSASAWAQTARFQPTLPARGATSHATGNRETFRHFNPRSPHGERPHSAAGFSGWGYFNPRSPHGERRARFFVLPFPQQFQPTLPARGATQACPSDRQLPFAISTHAPRTGSDFATLPAPDECFTFQPTLPARGATSCRRR